MAYPFLILCLLLLIPGVLIFLLRPDLRKPMGIVAACAVPFAFTEFLFYPDYWEPRFLFDLADRIGFGIEDFLFVTGLGAFTSTVYPFIFRKSFTKYEASISAETGGQPLRVALPIAIALLLAFVLYLVNIPVIWGCVPIMVLIAATMVWIRPDLPGPSLWGGVLSAGFYFLICLLLGAIVPDVFALNWHADQFSNLFLLGVPAEEVAYAFGAGTVAAVFYPFTFRSRFQPLRHKES
jgi:hypothetical protein